MTIIPQNMLKNQLPTEFKFAFNELQILKHLREAGISKVTGFSCVYIFQIIFCLVFEKRTWFNLSTSKHKTELPCKDAIYRFLNYHRFAWRRFLLLLSARFVTIIDRLTPSQRVKVFIVDDSTYYRNRSKKVELLAKCFDHGNGKYYNGFRMLTLGWSDGHSFAPIDFVLLSSIKKQLKALTCNIDKRTHGYKRRMEAVQKAPSLIPSMLERALAAGIDASYLLMDSWFTNAPLIKETLAHGVDVIGMLKNGKQRYAFGDKMLTLKQLYGVAKPIEGTSNNILKSVTVQMQETITTKIVFVRRKGNKREWLAILSTDCHLSEEEIVKIYRMRWDIETFFKCTKSLLKLQNEFQGRSYDMLVSHTTIVFARYILLTYNQRLASDVRALGGMFYEMCEAVTDRHWRDALNQLLAIIDDIQKGGSKISGFFKSQLLIWFDSLPCFIKGSLPFSWCES